MKKIAITLLMFSASLCAQVQLGKNVQIGSSAAGTVTQVNTDSTSGITGGPITTTGTVACSQSTASQFGCVKPDGTTITASGGVLTATGPGGFQAQIIPPIAGQYVFVPAGTPTIAVNNGGASAATSSANLVLAGGGSFEIDVTINWANPVLPSYIVPANVTAVYAIAFSSQTNFHYYNSILHGPGNGMAANLSCGGQSVAGTGSDGWVSQQAAAVTSLTGATFGTGTCTAHIGANYSGGGNMNVPLLGYLVYYTGTAPPASTAVNVAPPLSYNAATSTLSISAPFDVLTDSGAVNAYAVSTTSVNFVKGATIKMLAAHANTSATPTLTFNGNNAYTVVGPTGLPLAAGDLSTSIPASLMWSGSNWILINPQVSQPTSGSGASQSVIASATTIAPTSRFFHVSGTTTISTITAPAFCVVTGTMCQITMIPDGLWTTATGGNIAIGSTAVVGKALVMTYDPATTSWYPSY